MVAADLVPDTPLSRGPSTPTGREEVDRFLAAQDGQAAYMVPGDSPEADRCMFTGVLMEGLWGAKPNAFSIGRPDVVTSQSLAAFLRHEVPARAAVYSRVLKPTVQPSFSEGRDHYFSRTSDPQPPPLGDWPPPGPPPSPPPAEPGRSFKMGRAGPPTTDYLSMDFGRARVPPKPPGAFQTWLRRAGQPDVEHDLVIDGGKPVAIWSDTRPQASAAVGDGARLSFASDRPVSALVQFGGGEAGGLVVLPSLTTYALRTERGLTALSLAARSTGAALSSRLAWALARLENSALRSADLDELAASLRGSSHPDPVLGVISAYLYAAVDDIDSIRGLAVLHAQRGEFIPYDIALLGRLSRLDGDRLAIPAGQGTSEGAPATVGRLAGLWPWMRQGWSLLEDRDDQPGWIVAPGLAELARHLTTSRFTTLRPEGAEALAQLFGLEKQPL